MPNHSVVTWNTVLLYEGDPVALLDFHDSIGAEAICIKIGNGKTPWVGLEPAIAEAKRRGKKVVGWHYVKGLKDEEYIIADNAEELGVDLLVPDVEGHWKRNAPLTDKARRAKAERWMKVFTTRFSGEIALCSVWKPSLHKKIPVEVFLNNGCTLNMPMLYWIGRRTNAGVITLIEESLEEYGRLANWSPSETIPILASYGQSYTIRLKKYWWKTTVEQMKVAYDHSIKMGCPSVSWWCLDYLLGGPGHEAPKGIPEHRFIETIRSFGSAPPTPSPVPATLREMARKLRLDAGLLDRIASELNQ